MSWRLGEWPRLLTLANAQLRAKIGLEALDSGDEVSRNSAAGLSIGASLGCLGAAKGEVVPASTISPYSRRTGTSRRPPSRASGRPLAASDLLAGEVLLRTVMRWALLLGYDRGAGTVHLHDVVRKFLRDSAGADVAQA